MLLATAKYRVFMSILLGLYFAVPGVAQTYPGADQHTPARAEYFSWINNTNEGASAEQTLVNLDFFAWLKKAYGLQLDIYAFDAGAIDGKRWYGSTASERFRQQFPQGLNPIFQRTNELGIRLGVWGGPDGFGNTKAQENERIRMMVELCDRYQFALFKFDAVAGQLRDEKQNAFARMMKECRKAAPDLILLNHRLNLGEVGTPHATTFLWEGQETYIDVHLANDKPALHHRAAALARGLPPKLSRLTEDHGVCLSAPFDYWDDELILQAFNRALILSPQIYCNPWLLRDDEFAKLARIFNLARKYRTILVDGSVLPKRRYGEHAVTRGDGKTQLLTLRNLSWQPITYTLRLSNEIGLIKPDEQKQYEVRQFHPSEHIIGDFSYGAKVPITVAPFRSALIRVTTDKDFGISGSHYEVIRDLPGEPMEILLTGNPGETVDISLKNAEGLTSVKLDDVDIEDLEAKGLLNKDSSLSVTFSGTQLTQKTYRYLGQLTSTSYPPDAEPLYESTIFSSDNNALEVRALKRSGESSIAEVKKARDAFFTQQTFIDRGIWDQNLFDSDSNTAFFRMQRWSYQWNSDPDATINGGAFRLDLGAPTKVDYIELESRDEVSIQPLKVGEGIIAEVSEDLKNWTPVNFVASPSMRISMPTKGFRIRYLRLAEAPAWLSEVRAVYKNELLDRRGWRASNLFGHYKAMNFSKAWQKRIVLNEIVPDAYLAVTVPGNVGNESVYAAVRVNGEFNPQTKSPKAKPKKVNPQIINSQIINSQIIGASDRSPSYPANTWELQVKPVDGNYTYYIALDPSLQGKPLDVVLLGDSDVGNLKADVWLTRYPKPLAQRKLTFGRNSE